MLYCDHTVPLSSVCDIYLQLTDQAIQNPETNIRLAWAAVTLGNRLLVGLCQCFEAICTCATQKTGEILSSLKNSQAQIYCRERARNRDPASVIQQFSNRQHLVRKTESMQTPPSSDRGGIGNHNGTLHNPWRPHGKSKLYDSRHLGDSSGNCFHTPIRGKGELD